ncbi:sugar dehydrogenase complex small subunit [Winslowiella toletana]|nr:sugar dehydrogenase complex small subunit [Winslowiella toletana]
MITRRQVLISGAAMCGFAALTPTLSWASLPAANSDLNVFSTLSKLLTRRAALSQVVSARALHCLAAEDADFIVKMHALTDALQRASITDVDQLNNHPIMQNRLASEAIKKIVSAWYLGFTGTPVSMRAVDNTRFVTYTDALMYAPTIDATVIPTYSRGHTNYWTQPPATIKND